MSTENPAAEPDEIRDRIVLATLPHVAFEGWTERAVRAGVADAGLSPGKGQLAFTGGTAEMITYWSHWADRRMQDALLRLDPETLRVRERIAAAVRYRIEVNIPYREAVRRTLSLLALPPNAPLALRCTYATLNAIWYACGDTSTDFAFYTKRATLAAVYTSTVLHWLDDSSEEFADTWAFLDRRIDDVMQIPHLRARLRQALRGIGLPALRPRDARHG